MKLDDFKTYKQAQRRFVMCNKLLLVFLALGLLCLYMWSGGGVTSQERRLMEHVRTAQGRLYDWRVRGGSEFAPLDDPHRTGFIGLEWSELSTTVGLLAAKRTACDPRWSVIIRRWMEDLQIREGDCVAIYSSSSFPGMAFNAIAALESLKIQPLLVVSLGASVYGANDPLFPWPVIENKLRSEGFIKTKASFYTPGGNNETGGGVSAEARAIFTQAAADADIPLIIKDNLQEVISWKLSLLKEHGVKAVISIGGSEGNMGDDPAILRLAPGLHRAGKGGDGVIGKALEAGYPVIHLLNIKGLATECGVPFDAPPSLLLHGRRLFIAATAASVLFAIVMFKFKRWNIM